MTYFASRVFFFFNDTATTEIYTLSLHDALPISMKWPGVQSGVQPQISNRKLWRISSPRGVWATIISCSRSEEHTSELQSRLHLVCRLLLEKKKTKQAGKTHQPSCSQPRS